MLCDYFQFSHRKRAKPWEYLLEQIVIDIHKSLELILLPFYRTPIQNSCFLQIPILVFGNTDKNQYININTIQ